MSRCLCTMSSEEIDGRKGEDGKSDAGDGIGKKLSNMRTLKTKGLFDTLFWTTFMIGPIRPCYCQGRRCMVSSNLITWKKGRRLRRQTLERGRLKVRTCLCHSLYMKITSDSVMGLQ
jgi:hypothetical protein